MVVTSADDLAGVMAEQLVVSLAGVMVEQMVGEKVAWMGWMWDRKMEDLMVVLMESMMG